MPFKVIQGHLDFGTNRKLIYDFLLVINTNLPPILHRFQVMADYLSNFASDRDRSILRPSLGWSPANIAINDISLKPDSLGYISVAESTGVSSTTFT